MIVARRILSVFGGEIEQTQDAGGPLFVRITLLVAGGTSVLVIDDNSDVLQLYERYVLGTRFRLTLCQKAELALQVAASLQPQIIIIDIMMPGLDGWSLLGQLSHHPATATIPVIVSTVVSERDLALTLGAVDFVQKPVNRAEFLDALTRSAKAPILTEIGKGTEQFGRRDALAPHGDHRPGGHRLGIDVLRRNDQDWNLANRGVGVFGRQNLIPPSTRGMARSNSSRSGWRVCMR